MSVTSQVTIYCLIRLEGAAVCQKYEIMQFRSNLLCLNDKLSEFPRCKVVCPNNCQVNKISV